ncbi:helix-turn-helix domain-containing protein [Planomonospora sp. ID91781]|uniref:XRE family transcriptional regulator n=2 Tax=Streptosporangiaceae TaxID=2004 RepID=A0A171C170_9ACTN|nr:helix-turn-helix domain-containing protein [Planomonospora sp. ID91781]GAT65930.1 XRE family transcriptional regulator [Planomonospora sphaerica]
MASRRSPTARHRRLMAELNRLRENSGLSRVEVAERIGSTDTTIWRYETGLTRPKPTDVAALTTVYGVTGQERDSLVQMAREARQRGWWHRHRQALKPGFDSYIGLEAEASVVRSYEPLVVPGLMQTEPYARAVIEATSITHTPSEVDEKVSVRISRQRLLHGSSDPIQLVAVLDEAVLRRRVGGREVMREQLERLVDLGRLPNVEIRVIPFSAGAHAAVDGKFCLLSFPEPEDPDLVYLEQAASGLVPEDPEEVRRYTLMFGSLTAMAFGTEASAAFIAQVAKEL